MTIKTDTLIIGGGLAGLYLAQQLETKGDDYHLIEARPRFGGRIYSPAIKAGQNHFDMGPAWFWPGQPRIAKLLDELSIPYFNQASQGNLVFEDQAGQIRRDIDMTTMEGAHRVDGGLGRVIDALVSLLPAERLQLSSHATAIQINERGICVSLKGEQPDIFAKKVIICVPPRLAEHSIQFLPPLPHQVVHRMQQCPTWMAAHAKFIAVYETPFWRDNGLSGDGISHKGPMMELHDASPHSEDLRDQQGAIFGFLGVPAEARKSQQDNIVEVCKQQLVRLYGKSAVAPIKVFYKDWSVDPFTATPDDANSPQSHPHYSSIVIKEGEWQNRLFFSSTETAQQFGGFLEGALEAVDTLIRQA